MREVLILTKRNILVYLRDKASVFFSFLSVIILLLIYVLFLKNIFGNYGLDEASKNIFMVGYIMGGVMIVGTVTFSLGVMANYVQDLSNKKINGYLVAPTKRYKLTLSYFLSTVLLTFVLNFLLFMITFFYLGIKSSNWYSFSQVMTIIGLIMAFGLISSSIMIFIVSFISSMGAFSAVSAISGTLIGFISGIYIPFTNLDIVTQNIAGITPFSHMTYYLRKILIGDLFDHLPESVLYNSGLVQVPIFSQIPSNYILWTLGGIVTLLMLTLAYVRINRKQV